MANLAKHLGVFFFVLVFGITALFGLPSVQDVDSSPWQAVLLDEDEADPLESKTVVALPDSQAALPSSGTAATPFSRSLPADHSQTFVLVSILRTAPNGPRAPPSA